jgi:hypothetical protein
MATQETTIHSFPAQEPVAQTIPIAVYELKLFPLTLQPKRLHPHSTPSLIVSVRNHSPGLAIPFNDGTRRPPQVRQTAEGQVWDEDVTFPKKENTRCEEPI